MNVAPARTPEIFDRALIRRRLARALAAGAEDFLLPRAAEDLVERLSTVKRTFRAVLDLGTPRFAVAARLAEALPDADMVRAAPTAAALGAGDGLGSSRTRSGCRSGRPASTSRCRCSRSMPSTTCRGRSCRCVGR